LKQIGKGETPDGGVRIFLKTKRHWAISEAPITEDISVEGASICGGD
jgi:hypothetical protein